MKDARPGLSDNMVGALWALLSVAAAVAMTVFVREAAAELHSRMLAFLRSALGLALTGPLLFGAARRGELRISRPMAHLLRGALTALALNLGFYAIWKLPLVVATLLFFMAPVFSTALAPIMLKERVGAWRWGAVAAGFIGAVIVLRPDTGAFEPAMLAAVGSSFCLALSLLIGKTLTAADGSAATYASTTVLTAVMTLPLALTHWAVPETLALWAIVAALALASALRQYADIRSYGVGEASFVAPLTYLRLPALALIGWAAFGESVDEATFLGGLVIVGATLTIALRDRRARR